MRYKLPILAIISVLFFSQCKKEKNEDPATTSTPNTQTSSGPNTLAELFAQNGSQVQTSQISVSSGQTLTVGGAKITISPGSFMTGSGGTVSGTIDISVKGVFTKKDIILSGAPANANGKLISTKGCIKVSASQNSQTLRVSPGGNVIVKVPEPGATPLYTIKKFYASAISVSDSTKIWRPAADSNAVSPQYDNTTQTYSYPARLDSAAWLNTGYVWDTVAPKTSVTVTIDTAYAANATNCAVYISLNGSITVGALYYHGSGTYSITNIPVGKNVVLIALGIKNGTYYYASAPVTISNGHTQNMSPQSTTLSNIQTQLSALP